MKLSCLQENLNKAISIVSKVVATRSTLPVLSNILIKTEKGRLKLSATNLEIGISCWIGVQAFVNLFAMVHLIPLTGVPLPFISYGGSSMIVSLMGIGVLLNISRTSGS